MRNQTCNDAIMQHQEDSKMECSLMQSGEVNVALANSSEHLKHPLEMGDSPDPPFETAFKDLIDDAKAKTTPHEEEIPIIFIEECELPLIDLSRLNLGESEREACKKLIAEASREWGFFQVKNHGIRREVLEKMRDEQVKLFKKPFHEKVSYKDLNFLEGSYRWGTPTATCLKQLSWSEAFHVPLGDVLGSSACPSKSSLSLTMEQFASAVSELAHKLSDILAEELGYLNDKTSKDFFRETCLPSSCYLRLNHYLPCPIYARMSGITQHTDSSFLTVLHQHSIGGLQIVKDGRWIAVKPDPETLVINIGDIFQAWSNDVYKSVEHRVVSNAMKERFSTAYFFCPMGDTVIESNGTDGADRVYRSFSFGEYIKQVKYDVKNLGDKVGLPRFLI